MSPGAVALPVPAPSTEFLRLIPRDFARQNLLFSRGRSGEPDASEHLAVSAATSPAAAWNAGVRLGVRARTRTEDAEVIARDIDSCYESAAHARAASTDPAGAGAAARDADPDIDALLRQADQDLLTTQGKGPIVRLIDALLFEALGRSASDLHIQPLADRVLVRYRVDGVLRTIRDLPPRFGAPLVSRIKVMGRMDIAERRVPQDGRATVTIGPSDGGRSIDLRISTLPTSYGERAVIRLLENSRAVHLESLAALGMPPEVQSRYLARVSRPNGIVLVTGPTGSGKTTTLYATLRLVAKGEDGPGLAGGADALNIMTIEDPIEYELSTVGLAVSQAQVNAKKGVTFATGLRHILRQDPDVIMVGEIRDAETARIAIQSSLTGHLVLSTLHTNDAPSSLTRLTDLGVEPYLVAASLEAVLAQRLVRTVHDTCAGAGCSACLGTGFRGRTGLYELLTVDEPIRELISHGAPLRALRDAAVRGGMRTLASEGRSLVRAGRSTPTEITRVVGDDEAGVGGAA